MEPTILDELGWLLCNPHTLPAGCLLAFAPGHTFFTRRRGLALQFLWASWLALLILDLIGLQGLLHALLAPHGCVLWSPRICLLQLHVPHLALALVTIPLVALSGRPPRTIRHHGGAVVTLAAVHVVVVFHLSLWLITTPEGTLPSAATYLSMLTW